MKKDHGFGAGHSSVIGMHMGGNWHPMASSNPMSQDCSSALHGQVTGHSIPSFPIGPNLIEMIHYSQEDLVVIEFTDQGPSIRKGSKVRCFSRGLLILFYYKGQGL